METTVNIVLIVLLVAVLIRDAVHHWGGRVLRNALEETKNRWEGEPLNFGEHEVSEGVEALMVRTGSLPITTSLRRHQLADWGEIDAGNRRLNSASLGEGGRFGFESAYRMGDGTALRIITFEDCWLTLLLTEEEYHQAVHSKDEEYQLHVRALSECLEEQDLPKEH
jgi:hypothetical protein